MSNSIKEHNELDRLAIENYSKDEATFLDRIDINNVPVSSQEALLEIVGPVEDDVRNNMLALVAQGEIMKAVQKIILHLCLAMLLSQMKMKC